MKFQDLWQFKTVIFVRKAKSNLLPPNLQAKFKVHDSLRILCVARASLEPAFREPNQNIAV